VFEAMEKEGVAEAVINFVVQDSKVNLAKTPAK
jgi:hypothetical protein